MTLFPLLELGSPLTDDALRRKSSLWAVNFFPTAIAGAFPTAYLSPRHPSHIRPINRTRHEQGRASSQSDKT